MRVGVREFAGPRLIVGLSAALVACGSGSGTPTESSVASSQSAGSGVVSGLGGCLRGE